MTNSHWRRAHPKMMPMTIQEPGYNRCVRLVVIRLKLLLSTMKVEVSLILLDLIGGDVPLTMHIPY